MLSANIPPTNYTIVGAMQVDIIQQEQRNPSEVQRKHYTVQ